MGRKVFVSIVGKGKKNEETGRWDFENAVYQLDGKSSSETKYVQVAVVELLDRPFDIAYLLCTPESKDAHFGTLKSQFEVKRIADVEAIVVEFDNRPDQLWKWLGQLSQRIKSGDCIVFDITHGGKLHTVMATLAIDFLRKKSATIEHVFYGSFDKEQKRRPKRGILQDLVDFFRINDWTDALQAIKDRFDPEPFAKMLTKQPPKTPRETTKTAKRFANELKNLRRICYGAAMHVFIGYAYKVNNALKAWLDQLRRDQTDRPQQFVAEHLAEQIKEKLQPFVDPWDGHYDRYYFESQLDYLRLLIKHHLLMQAYTVLWELVISTAFVNSNSMATSKNGSQKRLDIGKVWTNMLKGYGIKESTDRNDVERLKSISRQLDGALPKREIFINIADYRNSFDHAWTPMAEGIELTDAAEKIEEFYTAMKRIVKRLIETGMVR